MKPGLNYVNAAWRPSRTGKTFAQHNPADLSDRTGLHQDSDVEDVREAIAAAQAAYPAWRATPPPERARLLRRVLAAMQARADEVAACITRENGKTLDESHAEIQSAVAEMDFQVSEGLRLYGTTVPSGKPGVLAYTIRQPLGVAAIITPWNFPWNVPTRKATPALMAGNTVVLKPASLTPGVGRLFADLFAEAEFPPGVVNFVTGRGGDIGRELVDNAAVQAVSFTGSTSVGHAIQQAAARTLTRTQLEMGGKNAAVVLADADVDLAARACAQAAFACAGQWCTSTSRAIVEAPVYDAFADKITAHARALRLGDGRKTATDMGPVCGERQLEGILSHIEDGKSADATVLCGGARATDGPLARGCFVAPTVFGDVAPDMSIARHEIFGPVLCLMRAQSFAHAMDLANDVAYGLSSSVFTRDVSAALRFVEGTEVGLTHVNVMTAYKEPSLCFGGTKESGAGLPEAGHTGIEFFTREKAVYIGYA